MQGYYNIIEWDGTREIVYVKPLGHWSAQPHVIRYNDGVEHVCNERYIREVLRASLCWDSQLNAASPQCWSPKL